MMMVDTERVTNSMVNETNDRNEYIKTSSNQSLRCSVNMLIIICSRVNFLRQKFQKTSTFKNYTLKNSISWKPRKKSKTEYGTANFLYCGDKKYSMLEPFGNREF